MKKKIIISSVVIAILAIMLILFGLVFCIRKESVSFVGDRNLTNNITNEEIYKASGLKKGSPIFFIDKNEAINNIESKFEYIKVIQIKTISVIQIQFVIRERVAMYYTTYNNQYYILDEELKVLNISDTKPQNLIMIEDNFGITNETKICDFIGTSYQQSIAYHFFTSMYNAVKIDGEYLDRAEICNLIIDIEFEDGYTLTESYDRMIINTSYGVQLDIAKPNENLEYKVNVLFSSINSLTEEDLSKGTLKCYYTAEGEMKFGYFND